MVTAYDAPSRAGGRRRRRRHDPRGRLARDGRARLRRHAPGDDRRHGPPRRCGRADQAATRSIVGDLPWMSYHVSREETVRNAAALDPRRRRRGEARRWPQAPRRDHRDPRHRDPGDGPPRAHPAVDPRDRRVQGAGQAARRGPRASSTTRWRWPRPAASRSCSSACPTASPGWSPTRSTVPTIGIGAGRHCDGQVLVYHDLLGFEDRMLPRFVRRYAELGADRPPRPSAASSTTCGPGRFPSSDETYHMTDQLERRIDLYAGGRPGDGADRRARGRAVVTPPG